MRPIVQRSFLTGNAQFVNADLRRFPCHVVDLRGLGSLRQFQFDANENETPSLKELFETRNVDESDFD